MATTMTTAYICDHFSGPDRENYRTVDYECYDCMNKTLFEIDKACYTRWVPVIEQKHSRIALIEALDPKAICATFNWTNASELRHLKEDLDEAIKKFDKEVEGIWAKLKEHYGPNGEDLKAMEEDFLIASEEALLDAMMM
ncbi:uncharacterized protein KY384_003907 [Bacidia gigantensis]|uniref:uncharacterized protein n=1 Tax=Bacidia gigantensis TaxID=2732470 RepID=UPI001D053ADB|nr:uncharacterized protein KY384_003907 [Bacidia gigantensis]KAG8532266.1 hypothetical protein KY384_003907 [Bacidia gigantensis]